MATCEVTLPTVTLENATDMDVIGKYRELSEAALATDSIYMRAKDTFKELFDGKQISTNEYAALAGQFISGLSVELSKSAMASAVQWAIQEKEMAYSLSQAKSNINIANATVEKIKKEICLADKELELKCAQVGATVSASIRDNGRVQTYAADGCTPTSLYAEGTKYAQLKTLQAQTYSTLADAYRKSGKVAIGTDTDGELKGLSGDAAGYTNAQDRFARRQILSFEDSKRSHAANAISQMIGQLLATETIPSSTYVAQWNEAVSYLNTNTLDANNDGIPDPIV